MNQPTRAALVAELTALLTAGNAHATFEPAIADLPAPLRNQVVPEVPYPIWHLVERSSGWHIAATSLITSTSALARLAPIATAR